MRTAVIVAVNSMAVLVAAVAAVIEPDAMQRIHL